MVRRMDWIADLLEDFGQWLSNRSLEDWFVFLFAFNVVGFSVLAVLIVLFLLTK